MTGSWKLRVFGFRSSFLLVSYNSGRKPSLGLTQDEVQLHYDTTTWKSDASTSTYRGPNQCPSLRVCVSAVVWTQRRRYLIRTRCLWQFVASKGPSSATTFQRQSLAMFSIEPAICHDNSSVSLFRCFPVSESDNTAPVWKANCLVDKMLPVSQDVPLAET